MPFNDIREFIAKCEELGDAVQVKQEVDWNLEAGAITRRCCEQSGPAPLFQKVKDYPNGYRIWGAPLATFRRLAIAMDLDPDASFRQIMDAYIQGSAQPVKPRVVKEGPCKQNMMIGDDVDLYKFRLP
jgi:UbiD family decarboxylase